MSATTDLEPTAEEREEIAAKAHGIDQAIRDALLEGRHALWRVAEGIHEFDAMAGWDWLGYENKSEWLADPEISMTSTTYYRLLGVWRELAVHRKIDPDEFTGLEISKVAIVLRQLQTGKITQKEALGDAEALGARDLREKYIVPRPVYTDDDDVIDGVEVAPAYPSEEMWEEVVARAKSRRRNLVTYITQMRDWEKVGEGDGTSREDWILPAIVGGEDEEEDEGSASEEGLSGSVNGSGARAAIDRAKVVAQAQKDWKALRDELLTVAEAVRLTPGSTCVSSGPACRARIS